MMAFVDTECHIHRSECRFEALRSIEHHERVLSGCWMKTRALSILVLTGWGGGLHIKHASLQIQFSKNFWLALMLRVLVRLVTYLMLQSARQCSDPLFDRSTRS